MNKRLFGYDKFMMPVYDGAIIKCFHHPEQRFKIGHLWYCIIGEHEQWVLSYNHAYSESADPLESMRDISQIKIIGHIDRGGYGMDREDEYILQEHFDGWISTKEYYKSKGMKL